MNVASCGLYWAIAMKNRCTKSRWWSSDCAILCWHTFIFAGCPELTMNCWGEKGAFNFKCIHLDSSINRAWMVLRNTFDFFLSISWKSRFLFFLWKIYCWPDSWRKFRTWLDVSVSSEFHLYLIRCYIKLFDDVTMFSKEREEISLMRINLSLHYHQFSMNYSLRFFVFDIS